MQECDACGLVFGGSDTCPSCGSRVSHIAEVSETNGQAQPKGDLPGLNQLNESMDGISGLDSVASESPARGASSLPFSVGGSGGGQTSLPFTFGSPTGDREEPSEALPSRAPEPAEEVTEEVPEITAQDDPWADLEAPSDQHQPEPESVPESQPVPDSPSIEPSVTPQHPQTVDSDAEEVSAAPAEPEVVMVARIIDESPPQTQPSPTEHEPPSAPLEAGQEVESSEVIHTPTIDEKVEHFHPSDADVYMSEEEVVYHDFGDELQVSEVMVDFDSLVDPAEVAIAFDPSAFEGGEPELMPARALALTNFQDSALSEFSQKGFSALANADWGEAAEQFRAICETQPTNAASLNNFGLALLQKALLTHEESPSLHPAEEPHFEAAVLALRQAAKADPVDASILCNLATSLTACYRHEAALQFYDAALSLDSNDIPAMNGKAVSMIGLRQFDDAIELLRSAVQIAPNEAIVSANLHRISPMG